MEKYRVDHTSFQQNEIERLAGVTTPQHINENELVHIFRDHKYNVRLCSYSFELLVSFLHEKKFMLLLSIVNRYLNVIGKIFITFYINNIYLIILILILL